jgi:hypothetical protein
MAKTSGYPDIYGKPTKALPLIMGPLNIDAEGDALVPRNDMAEVGGGLADGKGISDPMGFLTPIEGKGKK